METPILNKKQQSSTLSGKKSKTKQIIKNVLVTPFDNRYWPEVSNEDHIILKRTLENYLPRIKLPKVNIPWNELKETVKADRKKIRLEFMKKMGQEIEINTSEGKGLVLGVNDITKCLENNDLDAVLITSDVQPRLMVQHLIEQSILNGIHVLVVKDLRTLVKDKCGLESVAVGVAKNLISNSKLNIIRNTIQEISEHYPVPSDHINYHRSLKFSSDHQDNIDENMESLPKHKIDIEDLKNKYHLIRQSKDKRMFIPNEIVLESSKKTDIEKLFQPFLEDILEGPKVSSYKPLKVKRLKSDVNRNKRIAKALKNKS